MKFFKLTFHYNALNNISFTVVINNNSNKLYENMYRM